MELVFDENGINTTIDITNKAKQSMESAYNNLKSISIPNNFSDYESLKELTNDLNNTTITNTKSVINDLNNAIDNMHIAENENKALIDSLSLDSNTTTNCENNDTSPDQQTTSKKNSTTQKNADEKVTGQTKNSKIITSNSKKDIEIKKQKTVFSKYTGKALKYIYNDKSVIQPGKHWGSDGFCIAGDYYVSGLIQSKNPKRFLIVIDKSGKVVCKYQLPSTCHCNVASYDPYNKRIILSTDDKAPVVLKFDEATGQITKQIQISSNLKGAFTYNDSSKQYLQLLNVSKKIQKEPNKNNHKIPKNYYKLDICAYSSKEFRTGPQKYTTVHLARIKSHETINGRTCYLKKQGCTCHNNCLYYAFTVRDSQTGVVVQNRVVVFDLSQRNSSGHVPKKKTIIINVPYPDKETNENELEGVDFDTNGNMVLMYRKKCQMYYV